MYVCNEWRLRCHIKYGLWPLFALKSQEIFSPCGCVCLIASGLCLSGSAGSASSCVSLLSILTSDRYSVIRMLVFLQYYSLPLQLYCCSWCSHRISFKQKLIQGKKLLIQDNVIDYVTTHVFLHIAQCYTCFQEFPSGIWVWENFLRNNSNFSFNPHFGVIYFALNID